MRERALALAAIAAVAILVDCGGGGGGGSTVAPTGTMATSAPTGLVAPAGTLKATMSITIPAAPASSSSSRRVKMIPSNTKSIVFTLAQTSGTGLAPGTVQGPFGLTSTSPGCAAAPNGNVTCTLSINAPIGSDIFTADIYSSTNAAAGTQLGSGAVQFSVAQNAANTASISLNGPISQILLADDCPISNLVPGYYFAVGCILGNFNYILSNVRGGLPAGSVRRPIAVATSSSVPYLSQTRVFVVALDSSGNVVVNPTVYDQPVVLELIAGNGVLQLNVSYAGVSLPFTSGATSASTSSDPGTVQLWSPLDVATVTIVPNAVNSYAAGYVFGGIGSAPPNPVPTSPATSLPTPFLLIGAELPPTPTPAPTATPTPGPLTWTNPSGYGPANQGPVLNTVNGSTNPTTFQLEFPAPVPAPSTGPTAIPITVGLASNYAFGGSYTISDGGTSLPGCVLNQVIAGLPSTVSATGTPFSSAPVTFDLQSISPTSCAITASDGSNSSELDIYVDSNSLTVQQHQRTSR